MVGRILGHYRVIEKLGAGGMGEVYRAHDEQLHREVAIKVLPASSFLDPAARAQLVREACLAAALNHPHICTIHEVGEADGQVYIAMELIAGQPLQRLIRVGGMPVDQVLRYGVQIADAVAHAHTRRVVHRDLKTGNIVVTPQGRAKVLDFGLAKRAIGDEWGEAPTASWASLTEAGGPVGTLPYMAPEQLRGQGADERSDVWALGVILHEMAAGARPFQARTGLELGSLILHQLPEPLPPHVTPDLRAIIGRCLEKEPERRYQRAGEVCAALEAIQTAATPIRVDSISALGHGISTTRWPAWVDFLGRRHLGLTVAIMALLIVFAVGRWGFSRVSPSSPLIRSLVVLPLDNLTGDEQQEYFVGGMHEALTAELARISALRVISRTSAMHYKEMRKPAPQIARELGVDGLVEGSVTRDGGRVRITVQLIHGPSDQHLWSDSHERDFGDILALQSDLARAIAAQIQATLTPAGQTPPGTARRIDPAAYEDYLRGLYHWNKLSNEGWSEAIVYLQKSIDEDSSYARAHALLSMAHSLQVYYTSSLPLEVHRQRAVTAAERAVSLDVTLAEAHASLALARFSFDWDWPAADRASSEAVRLNPASPMALYARAFFLTFMGRHDEAIRIGARAVELDPVSPHTNTQLAMFYFMSRRYDEAIAQANRVFAVEPDYVDAMIWACYAYARKGAIEEATRLRQRLEAIQGMRSWWSEAWLAALAGKPERTRGVFEEMPPDLVAIQMANPSSGFGRAVAYGEARDFEYAFNNLERAFVGRSPFMPLLKVDPRIDALRSHRRFQQLLERLAFP